MAVKKFAGARRPPPHEATPVDRSIALAIKALNSGTANDRQQQLALRWIVHECAGFPQNPFYPESARDTDFACGKRWVGDQIASIINMDLPVSK